jgi:saccharopine dehydrogenase-like NADP-dependent oxidoreductase
MLRVAIIGGYGNFGAHVARSLASDPAIQLILAGRSLAKARAAAAALDAVNPAEAGAYDLAGPPEPEAKTYCEVALPASAFTHASVAKRYLPSAC